MSNNRKMAKENMDYVYEYYTAINSYDLEEYLMTWGKTSLSMNCKL